MLPLPIFHEYLHHKSKAYFTRIIWTWLFLLPSPGLSCPIILKSRLTLKHAVLYGSSYEMLLLPGRKGHFLSHPWPFGHADLHLSSTTRPRRLSPGTFPCSTKFKLDAPLSATRVLCTYLHSYHTVLQLPPHISVSFTRH